MGIRVERGEGAFAVSAGDRQQRGTISQGSLFCAHHQRILHMPIGGAQRTMQLAPLRDVAVAKVGKQVRYSGFLLAVGFVFVTGISFEFALSVSGAFSRAVSAAVLLPGGGFLAAWWYSGGDTMVRITTGDTPFEGLAAGKREREATGFVNRLIELTSNTSLIVRRKSPSRPAHGQRRNYTTVKSGLMPGA